ncbi:MAG: hypothetical protein N2450_06745 [bacterium]|nr:hypothetical protein [bacterium]
MKRRWQLSVRIVAWCPRILAFGFAIFLLLFSLDAFSENHSFSEQLLSFTLHNLPTVFVLLILLLSWKREWMGGIVFPLLGLLYIVFTSGKMNGWTYGLITGSQCFIGILYWMSWITRKKHHIIS